MVAMKEFNTESEDFISTLKKLNLCNTSTAYLDLKNVLLEYSIPLPVITIEKGMILFRSRIHSDIEKYFSTTSELSHIPIGKRHLIKRGRANEPEQPIFYCSTMRELAFMETSKNVRNSKNASIEEVTTGVWEVKNNLRVVLLNRERDLQDVNVTLNKLNISTFEVKKLFNANLLGFLYPLMDYICEEFTKPNDENDFKITSAFANYFYDLYGWDMVLNKETEIDGIIYPSVQYCHEGLNVALDSRVVNKGNLELVKVMKSTMEKKNEELFMETKTEFCKEIKNGLIYW